MLTSGSLFTYEATDIAQEVEFAVSGFGTEGETLPTIKGTFRIKDPLSVDFTAINIAGLELNVSSHPKGIYGDSIFKAKLEDAINYYFENPPDIDTLALLESQGASLRWGGLFDINQDWLNPHCGHRNGKTIDLSINGLSENEKRLLQEAVSISGLTFYFSPESPFFDPRTDPIPNHWHIQEKLK